MSFCGAQYISCQKTVANSLYFTIKKFNLILQLLFYYFFEYSQL